MNELDAIRTLDDSIPRRVEDLHVAAERLSTAISKGSTAARPPWSVLPRRRRRRWLGAAAAAVAVVVLALGTIAIVRPGSSRGHPRSGADPTLTSTLPSAVISPAAFLQKAADTAAALSAFTPRPDQFLYVQETNYQAWLSIDGTHDGLIDNGEKIPAPGCRGGVQMVAGNYAGLRPQPCVADPAYLADAPTTPRAMAQYILEHADPSVPNTVGKEVLNLVEFHYLRPAAQAALYEATALLPDVTLSATTTQLSKTAVGIHWSFGGDSGLTLLFDPTSYAYLGVTTTGLAGERGGSGDYRQGIVDAVGQVP